jgi:hypothetical protein
LSYQYYELKKLRGGFYAEEEQFVKHYVQLKHE